jgi:hypothetical protein
MSDLKNSRETMSRRRLLRRGGGGRSVPQLDRRQANAFMRSVM